MNLDLINDSLEQKSWFFQEDFFEKELCRQITETYFNKEKKCLFSEAKIGKGNKKVQNTSIRKSETKWIESQDISPAISRLNLLLEEIKNSTSNYFRISLKRFESQFAIYNSGGFYKAHFDQHGNSKHRLISCVIYLNDCSKGGELVLYKKGSKTQIDKVISPKAGSIVLFFSADIFHEVKLVIDHRQSISTWFRDDEIPPFIPL